MIVECFRDTGQKYLDLSDVTSKPAEQQVVIQKSDSTTLYITRDIAAFIERFPLE